MKLILFTSLLVSALSGALVHAESIVLCRGEKGTVLTYSAYNKAFLFTIPDSSEIGPLPLIGQALAKPAPGRSDEYTLFSYQLADGYSAELLWQSTAREAGSLDKPTPIEAEVKKNGNVLVKYPACQWVYY